MSTAAASTPHPLVLRLQQGADLAMAVCLALMSLSVFLNVVLRYGFGAGIPATEELSRLLFVWMVFIGAAAAYPRGEHMAFTSLVGLLAGRPLAFRAMTLLIRLLTLLACALLARGAWQQVVVGLESHSVVLGYPVALLPLPALLCAVVIALCVLLELLRRTPLDLGHAAEVE